MVNGVDLLARKDAVELLGLDEKIFDNYFKKAGEFNPADRNGGKGRFKFSKTLLEDWLKEYKWRSVTLDRDNYRMCLDFALAMHFRGYVVSDWGTARQREFGQKLTNWIKGQLGEIAVKKFLRNKFSVDVELDFELHDAIVPQDVTMVESRKPKLDVSIKSSKPKSAYLVLSPNEVDLKERKSDVYIFCRPDLPDDHLLRITSEKIIEEVKNQQHFKLYEGEIPKFSPMPCEVAGFCYKQDLEKVRSIPGQEFDGERYVKQSGRLKRSKEDWKELIDKL